MRRGQDRLMQALVACICVSGSGLQAAVLNLCWTGANGYTMTGQITLPEAAMAQSVVTQDDVTHFTISGYQSGRLLGTWDMADTGPDTTWFLRFRPETMEFPTGDWFGTENSQGWNANGAVRNCGNPGFGFNAGNYAQDICVDGVYVTDSSIPPATPLLATANPISPDCAGAVPLSKAPKANHSD